MVCAANNIICLIFSSALPLKSPHQPKTNISAREDLTYFLPILMLEENGTHFFDSKGQERSVSSCFLNPTIGNPGGYVE